MSVPTFDEFVRQRRLAQAPGLGGVAPLPIRVAQPSSYAGDGLNPLQIEAQERMEALRLDVARRLLAAQAVLGRGAPPRSLANDAVAGSLYHAPMAAPAARRPVDPRLRPAASPWGGGERPSTAGAIMDATMWPLTALDRHLGEQMRVVATGGTPKSPVFWAVEAADRGRGGGGYGQWARDNRLRVIDAYERGVDTDRDGTIDLRGGEAVLWLFRSERRWWDTGGGDGRRDDGPRFVDPWGVVPDE